MNRSDIITAGKSALAAQGSWPEWVDTIAVQRLREAINGFPSHAYLLSGPDGVGKRELANAFAKAICCLNRATNGGTDACGNCKSCLAVDRGVHPDVDIFSLEYQAALTDKPGRGSNLTIETVRRVRTAAALLPSLAARRMLIVEDAETLLEPAQQALLKVLEEPPPAVTIVLLSDESEVLLPTVRSRCQEIPMRPVSDQTVHQMLAERGVEADLAVEVAMLSMGRPGWAIAAIADPKRLRMRRDQWHAAQSWVAASTYERLVTAFRLGDQFTQRRSEVYATVQSAVAILRQRMLSATQDLGGTRTVDPGEIRSAARAISASLQCLADLEANVRPRLALEAMVMAWPNPEPPLN